MVAVTTIITTHAEGILIIPSVESSRAAMKQLAVKGITYEQFIVMDRPTKTTRKAVEKCAADDSVKVIELDYGDQGRVRNHVAKLAAGKYIAFLDGDDMWSENWLLQAYEQAESINQLAVIYPEFNWFFEGSNNILCKIDDTADCFDGEALRAVNLWDALCFCPKEIYIKYPFANRDIANGFAYEDWNWNRRVYEAKIPQKVAKDTIIFKRRRSVSQGAHANKRRVIPALTKSCYFDYYSDQVNSTQR